MYSYKSIINRLSTHRRFEGGLLLNILGYQIFRITIFRLLFLLRAKRPIVSEEARAILKTLDEEGVVVIPNFLSETMFAEVKGECEQLVMEVYNEEVPRMLRGRCLTDGRHPPSIVEHLARNQTISQVVSAALRKDVLMDPGIDYDVSFIADGDFSKPSTETADTLHFDMSFPTIKCFYYVNDVSEENAAFSFVKRSHTMTLRRVWMEYIMSIRFSSWSVKQQKEMTPAVPESYLAKNNLQTTSINGKANTLIIANTMGFHKRGKFSSATPRKLIYLNYRNLDTFSYWKGLANTLNPFKHSNRHDEPNQLSN